MYHDEHSFVQWLENEQRTRSTDFIRPMSRPISKKFNRISDFIFPDTIHVRLAEPITYRRTENYSSPVLNHRRLDHQDLIVIERSPIADPTFLYQTTPNRPVVRRYSSYVDHQRPTAEKKPPIGIVARPTSCRDRIRERRKRHTMDNAYHSMLRSMIEEDEHISSLDQQQQQHFSFSAAHDTQRFEPRRSSISSRESSSDTEINERSFTNFPRQTNNSVLTSKKVLPTVWERSPQKNLVRSRSPFDNCLDDSSPGSFSTSPISSNNKHFQRQVQLRKRHSFNDRSTMRHEKTSSFERKQDFHSHVNRPVSMIDSISHEQIRPYFLIRPQTILVLPNEIAKFKCCFSGNPLPTLTWFHNRRLVLDSSNSPADANACRYQMHKLHDIHYFDIGPITMNDNGEVKCQISNQSGDEQSIVQLWVVPTPADGTPKIVQELIDVTVEQTQPLKLFCLINGLQVTVHWFHNGKLITPVNHKRRDYHNEPSMFHLPYCLNDDSGTVDCLVENRFGETRTSCRIEVVNPLRFTGESQRWN